MLIALVTFALAATVIVVLPGPDTLVVLRSIVRGGRRSGVTTAAGIMLGLTIWVCVAALGLAAVLRASQLGYEILKIAGACYLIWLGAQSLRTVRRGSGVVVERNSLIGTGFVAGLVTNLLNPKVGVFFVTFLPGFVPAGASVGLTSLIFGGVYLVLTLVYFVALLVLARRLADWMARPTIRRRLDAVTGTVLVGFGIRLAVES